jgi:hypothetical protein
MRDVGRAPEQVVLALLDVRAHEDRRRMRIAPLDRLDQVLVLVDDALKAIVTIAIALQ